MARNKGQLALYIQTAIPSPICLCRRFNLTLMKTWQGEHFWDADILRGCGAGCGLDLDVDVDVDVDMSSAAYHGGQQTKQTVHQPRPRDQKTESARPQPRATRKVQQRLQRHAKVWASVLASEKARPKATKVRIEDDVCSVHMRKRNFVVIYGPCRTCNMHAGQTNQRCCCCVRWCCCCSKQQQRQRQHPPL